MNNIIKNHINNHINRFKYIPVSIFVSVSLFSICLFYLTSLIKVIPCGKDILSNFYSNFTHVDIFHLIGNLSGLYVLSRVEQNIGSKNFIKLLVFLLVFNTITETIMHKIMPSTTCSIGFSGVLFGIATWEIITTQQVDYAAVLAIIFSAIRPTVNQIKTSISGHVIGAIGGIISGIIWSMMYKNRFT